VTAKLNKLCLVANDDVHLAWKFFSYI